MEAYTPSKSIRYLFSFFEFAKVALIFAIILLVIYFIFVQIFIVDGLSMFPNFLDREFMLVDRASYFVRSPNRGEVIIFIFPGTRSSRFVKRIIGLPGEHVEVKNGKIYINGKQLNEVNYLHVETLGNASYWLNDNEYFVLGDNREVSNDSRYWGPLDKGNIIGRAVSVILPLADKKTVPTPAYNI